MKTITTILLSLVAYISSAQIPNPCFENWSNNNPVGWITGNDTAPATTLQSSITYDSCSLAVNLTSSNGRGGFITTGTLSTSYFADNFIITGNPAALTGWFILNSAGNDHIEISGATKCADSINGRFLWKDSNTSTIYREFSACVQYSNPACVADSATITIKLANTSPTVTHANSYIIVDDLSFGNCFDAGIPSINDNVTIEKPYPNPASSICTFIYSIPSSGLVSLGLYDITGRMVLQVLNRANQTSGRYKVPIDVSSLPDGVYILTLVVDGQSYFQKITVQK